MIYPMINQPYNIPWLLGDQINEDYITGELREIFLTVADMFSGIVFPKFNDTHDTNLKLKIYNHYLINQIGLETPARFKHELSTRLNEIMPYYIKLLETETMIPVEDALINYDLTETTTETESGEVAQTAGSTVSTDNSAETTDNVLNERIKSDTPQSDIANAQTYMSEYEKVTGHNEHEQLDESEQVTTQSAEGTNSRVKSVQLIKRGNIGVRSLADDLKSYRASFQRVDEEIIKHLADLFLGIY